MEIILYSLYVVSFLIGALMSAHNIKLLKINKIGIILVFITGIVLGCLMMYPEIKPIDVYKGKTNLIITEKTINGVLIEKGRN